MYIIVYILIGTKQINTNFTLKICSLKKKTTGQYEMILH